jgi:glycosyltransferase involved in cell wall biosynthesis
VSGLHPPYVHFTKLIEYPDRFVFTSPVSYESKEAQKLPEALKSKLGVIWSTYGLEGFKDVQRTPHKGFNIGITGTVDRGKLHPNFIDLCAAVKIPDVRFLICSTDSQDYLKEQANALGIGSKFSFEGRVDSVKDYLCQYDVFGYPLQSTHFGSCEQALGEAMVCGAVPVVLNNTTERYIVEHMKTGIVANTLDEYVEAIEFLYNNRDELQRLSENAVQAARKRYDVKITLDKWDRLFSELLKQEKKPHKWGVEPLPPQIVYAISMGTYGEPFIDYIFADCIGDHKLKRTSVDDIKELYSTNPMFSSNRKGSIIQYLNYYPNNGYLRKWSALINEQE